ncbi:MAG: hypothetical protein Q7J98_01195 [Kiritimatiellia bacterium]|nr:hypothetical protein [Kiritimatiellia bacterium]
MAKIDVHIHITLDQNMDGYVKTMDRFGIKIALLHALPRNMMQRGNEAVARVVRRHRGRLIGSVHVDLRRPIKENICLARKYAQLGFKSI